MLPAPRASDPTSLGRRGGGSGHAAGPRPHCRTMLPPTGEPSPATEGEGWTRPTGLPAWRPQTPSLPLLSSACSALTLLTGQAGPALWAGAAARDRVAGAPVLADAGKLAVLAVQALGAGWETGRAARCSTRPPGPQGPGAPMGRVSAKTSIGPGSETSPRVTCPRPPGPTSPAVLGICTTSPGPSSPLGRVLRPLRIPGDPVRGAHTSAGTWAWLTLQAAGACPARAAATLSKDRVTGGPMEAGADLAAVVPIGEGWAGCRGEGGQGSGRRTLGGAAAD